MNGMAIISKTAGLGRGREIGMVEQPMLMKSGTSDSHSNRCRVGPVGTHNGRIMESRFEKGWRGKAGL